MSEEEKEALKASEADPEIAMSNLYTSMSADIVTTASEIDSEVSVEGLFILKRGKTFYYHGTTAARRLLQLQYDEYHKGRLNKIFMQLDSYFTLKDSVSTLAPTATNGPQPTKRAKLSAVKEKAMREAFKKLLAQAANAEHPIPSGSGHSRLWNPNLQAGDSESSLKVTGPGPPSRVLTNLKHCKFQAIVEAISGHRITVTPIDRRNEE
ncbi:hypothetical protein V1520DRAFT_365494 [Lipomyces starkeyi]